MKVFRRVCSFLMPFSDEADDLDESSVDYRCYFLMHSYH